MDRKALIREYKQSRRPMGVYRVRNIKSGKMLVAASVDLPAALNRHQAQLRLGVHAIRDLQKDWNKLGPEAFEFEVLDTLIPLDRPDYDPSDDLRLLEAMWIEKLLPPGDHGYQAAPSSSPAGNRRVPKE